MTLAAFGPRPRRGAITVLVAGLLTAMAGAAAWSVDIAQGLHVRTRLQAAADAGALAATHDLPPRPGQSAPDPSVVRATAVSWVGRNGYAISGGDVTLTPTAKPNTVIVGWQHVVPTSFARIFGILSFPVAVKAAAILGRPAVIPRGMLPFGVPAYRDGAGTWYALTGPSGNTYQPLQNNPPTQLALKRGGGNGNNGNYLALALDGSGASTYKETVVHGSSHTFTYGQVIATEPGDMVGPTKQGINQRLAQGGDATRILIPLVSKAEFDANAGRASITIVGFVTAHLNGVTGNGEVYASFESRVFDVPAVADGANTNASPGAYAPMLVLPPT